MTPVPLLFRPERLSHALFTIIVPVFQRAYVPTVCSAMLEEAVPLRREEVSRPRERMKKRAELLLIMGRTRTDTTSAYPSGRVTRVHSESAVVGSDEQWSQNPASARRTMNSSSPVSATL